MQMQPSKLSDHALKTEEKIYKDWVLDHFSVEEVRESMHQKGEWKMTSKRNTNIEDECLAKWKKCLQEEGVSNAWYVN